MNAIANRGIHPLLIAHRDNPAAILRRVSDADPLRLLVSGCIAGLPVGIDGTDYGMGGCLDELLSLRSIRPFTFCPETTALGVPRNMPDIHGGDGFDVLDGKARVLDELGNDLTDGMILGAEKMAEYARAERIELAVLTDMSAACGSQVISDGCRLVEDRKYRKGVGTATALLLRNGIPVVSQRDYRTLGLIRAHLDPAYVPAPSLIDHHQNTWYREYFGEQPSGQEAP